MNGAEPVTFFVVSIAFLAASSAVGFVVWIYRMRTADLKELRTAMDAIDAKANLALHQIPELRTEVATRYVSKEGFREVVANLQEAVKQGFEHLSSLSATNFEHLNDKIEWLAGTIRPEVERRQK